MTNWRTSLAGLFCLAITALIYLGKINATDAVTLIGAGAAAMGFLAHDSATGSSKATERVDAVVDSVETNDGKK